MLLNQRQKMNEKLHQAGLIFSSCHATVKIILSFAKAHSMNDDRSPNADIFWPLDAIFDAMEQVKDVMEAVTSEPIDGVEFVRLYYAGKTLQVISHLANGLAQERIGKCENRIAVIESINLIDNEMRRALELFDAGLLSFNVAA